DDEQGGPYYLQLRRDLCVDAARTNSGDGRWVNAPRGSRKRVNAKLAITPGTINGRVIALRKINPGDEIFVSYGSAYWRTHGTKTAPPATVAVLVSSQQFELMDQLREAAARTKPTPAMRMQPSRSSAPIARCDRPT